MCISGCKLFSDRLVSFKNLDIEEQEHAVPPVINSDGDNQVIMFPRTEGKPGTVVGISKYFQIFGLDAHTPRFDKIHQTEEEIQHDANSIGVAILETLQRSEDFNQGIANLKIWYEKLSVQCPDLLVVSGFDRKGQPGIGALEFDPTQRKIWKQDTHYSGHIIRSNFFKLHQTMSNPTEDPDSYTRFNRMEKLLPGAESLDDFIDLLSNHNDQGGQFSICRHEQNVTADTPKYLTGKYHTILSVISEYVFSSSELIVHYAVGSPCKTPFEKITLPG